MMKFCMLLVMFLVFLIICYVLQIEAAGTRHKSSIRGRHLVIAGSPGITILNLKRNATGHILGATGIGPLMLEWLSHYYHFTYSYLQVNETVFETVGGAPGLISYVSRGECDVLVSASVTTSRIALLDFTHPFSYLPINYLIPTAETSANLDFYYHPFSLWVWIALVFSLLLISLIFYGLNWYLSSLPTIENSDASGSILKGAGLYVISIFLHHPNYCTSKELMIRCLAAACGVAFLITGHVYTGSIISFVTSPQHRPMINSIEDVPHRPEIHLVMNKGLNIEAVILAAEDGLLHQLGDNLRSYPQSRCPTTQNCVDLVKSGSHVYVAASNTFLADAMKKDFLATKKCNLQLGKESFMDLPIPWAVRKGSPYARELNEGFMRMQEAGLLFIEWPRRFQAKIPQCITTKANREETFIGLSFANLTGIFLILVGGYAMSFTPDVTDDVPMNGATALTSI